MKCSVKYSIILNKVEKAPLDTVMFHNVTHVLFCHPKCCGSLPRKYSPVAVSFGRCPEYNVLVTFKHKKSRGKNLFCNVLFLADSHHLSLILCIRRQPRYSLMYLSKKENLLEGTPFITYIPKTFIKLCLLLNTTTTSYRILTMCHTLHHAFSMY